MPGDGTVTLFGDRAWREQLGGPRVLTCLCAADTAGDTRPGARATNHSSARIPRLRCSFNNHGVCNKTRLIDVFTQNIIHCLVQHVNVRGIYTVGLNEN